MESCVDDGWRMPDELWERMELLLPKYRRSRKGGRPRLSLRNVADGIFYVLRTGCQWKAASGVRIRQQFTRLLPAVDAPRRVSPVMAHGVLSTDDLKGIKWEFQSIDGALTKAPLGGEKNRPQSHGSSEIGRQTLGADRWRGRPAGRCRRRGQHARQTAA